MKPSSASAFAAIALLAGLGGCSHDAGLPVSEIYVLTDLSETWNNDASRVHNLSVLTEIGRGIFQYAQETEPPLSIEYRVIGKVSLGKLPLCDILFDPAQR